MKKAALRERLWDLCRLKLCYSERPPVPLEAVQRHMQQGQAQACRGAGHASMVREIRVSIAVIATLPVYRSDISGQEQIGPVPPRLFEGCGPAPLGHFGVVAADQHFGDLPSAKICRPRVMRKVEEYATATWVLGTKATL